MPLEEAQRKMMDDIDSFDAPIGGTFPVKACPVPAEMMAALMAFQKRRNDELQAAVDSMERFPSA